MNVNFNMPDFKNLKSTLTRVVQVKCTVIAWMGTNFLSNCSWPILVVQGPLMIMHLLYCTSLAHGGEAWHIRTH